MKKLLIALLFVIPAIACNQIQEQNKTDNSSSFSDMLDYYQEERLKFFPLDATQQGDNRYNRLLPNSQTQAFRDSLKAFYSSHESKLKSFDREDLSENDRISFDILSYELTMQLEGIALGLTDYNASIQVSYMVPFQQFWGLPITIAQLGSGTGFQPFKTVKDYENWLGRVKGFAEWTDSALVNFRKGIADGMVLPKSLAIKMIPQMEDMVVAEPEKSLFYDPVKNFPKDFSNTERQRLTETYKKAILEDIVPAYKKLGEFLKNEYLPKARTTTGISDVKSGKEIYTYLVKYWTTTNKTPDEIYQIGLAEVKRIRGEMEKVKNETGFKGDLNTFFQYMRTDLKFKPFKTPKEVLDAFRNIHKTMQPNLEKMFGRVPKTPFEIRQTEAFRAASASAEYLQGSPDGKRPGIFYLPILDATTFNITSGMESLFLHEAIPGHHYQVSLQQENEDLPAFRRFAWYGAYGEGYALYSESLGKELGLYTNAYQYMGALGDEIHRAIRLVVDVAMHTKGMTREQAIKYMMENEAIDEQGANAEIERYMAIPAQALSYKIGALKIRELRNKYQKQLGDKFNLSAFHDEFLKDGCMPLDIVEKKMDAWAENRK